MIDTALSVSDVAYRLGFTGAAELLAGVAWVKPAELYQFADDATKKIAYRSSLFISFDTSVAVVADSGVYDLPASHIFTLYALFEDLDGNVSPLRLTTVRDLWALDSIWSTSTAAAPTRCSLDAGSVGTITLYPVPTQPGTLEQICQEHPADVTQAASTVNVPTPLVDYYSYVMLAGARAKESDYRMSEMAEHFKARVDMYEQVFEHLWGPGR